MGIPTRRAERASTRAKSTYGTLCHGPGSLNTAATLAAEATGRTCLSLCLTPIYPTVYLTWARYRSRARLRISHSCPGHPRYPRHATSEATSGLDEHTALPIFCAEWQTVFWPVKPRFQPLPLRDWSESDGRRESVDLQGRVSSRWTLWSCRWTTRAVSGVIIRCDLDTVSSDGIEVGPTEAHACIGLSLCIQCVELQHHGFRSWQSVECSFLVRHSIRWLFKTSGFPPPWWKTPLPSVDRGCGRR